MVARIHIDVKPINHDWVKTLGFDFALLPDEEVERAFRSIGSDDVASLPALRNAPEPIRRALRVTDTMLKGDYVGHPFRGNQWVDASGVGRGGAGSSPDQDAQAYQMRQEGRSWEEIARALGYANGGSVRRLALRHEERLKQSLTVTPPVVTPPEVKPAPTAVSAPRGLPEPTNDPVVAAREGRPFTPLLEFPPELQAKLDRREAWSLNRMFLLAEARVVLNRYIDGLTPEQRKRNADLGATYASGGETLSDEQWKIIDAVDPSIRARMDADPYPDDLEPNVLAREIADSILVGAGARPRSEEEVKAREEARYSYAERQKLPPAWQESAADPDRISYETVSRDSNGRIVYGDQNVFARYVSFAPLIARGMTHQEIGELAAAADAAARAALYRHSSGFTRMSSQELAETDARQAQNASLLQKELDDAPVSITVTPRALSQILSDGRIKTQFETQTSRGYNSPTARAEEEAKRFGYLPNMVPEARPVYGMAEVGGLKVPSERDNLQYGNILIVLKPEVAARTTVTVGDSLSNARPSAPMRAIERVKGLFGRFIGAQFEPKPSEIKAGNVYLEATVHGGVRTSDIAQVVIQRGVQILNRAQEPVKMSSEPSAALLKALDKAGIPYQIVETTADIKAVSKARWLWPTVMLKGDYVGHPFRGNQWMDAYGVPRGGARSGADRPAGPPQLQGVDTVEEARRTGRPLRILQPENYPPAVKAALAANAQARDFLQRTYKEMVDETNDSTDDENRWLNDPRVRVAQAVLEITDRQARLALQHEYALALGFEESGAETESNEVYYYEEVYRDADGRLKREDEKAYISEVHRDPLHGSPNGPHVISDGKGGFQILWQDDTDPNRRFESFSRIDLGQYGVSPKGQDYGKDEGDGVLEGPKATAFALQEIVKQAKALGIDVPPPVRLPPLTAKPMMERLKAAGDIDPQNEVGLLISHIVAVGGDTSKRATRDRDAAIRFRDLDGIAGEWLKIQARDITPDTKVSVTVPANRVTAILKDGRLKTQFETGRSGGKNEPELRADFEAVLFGYPRGMAPEARPIYGMLETGGLQPSSIRGNEQYGQVTIVLKDEVKERTTFTKGDSLKLNVTAVPVAEASTRLAQHSVGTRADLQRETEYRSRGSGVIRGEQLGYYEAQIHGGVKTSDIERVIIDTRTYKNFEWVDSPPSPTLLRALDKAGIPYEIRSGVPLEKHLVRPSVLIKGDYVGHPFRGNQHVDASGAARAGAAEARLLRAAGSPAGELLTGRREYRVHLDDSLPSRWTPTLFVNGKPTTMQGKVAHLTPEKAAKELAKFEQQTEAVIAGVSKVTEVEGQKGTLAEITSQRADGRKVSYRLGWGEEGREEALREYTRDSIPINAKLRSGELTDGPLDAYMGSGPAATVYRTISNDRGQADAVAAALEGQAMIGDRGYASTSSVRAEAQQMDAMGDGILLQIRVPSGYPRVTVPNGIYNYDQSEVILPRGAKMRLVERSAPDDEGRRTYIVEIVDDDTAEQAVQKGDYVGHPFRGNQWVDANGISRGGAGSTPDQDKQAFDLRAEGKSWEEIAKIMGYANGGSVRRLAMRHEARIKDGDKKPDVITPPKPETPEDTDQGGKVSNAADPTSIRAARKIMRQLFPDGTAATLQAVFDRRQQSGSRDTQLTAEEKQIIAKLEEAGVLVNKAIQAEIARIGGLAPDEARQAAAALAVLQKQHDQMTTVAYELKSSSMEAASKALTGTTQGYAFGGTRLIQLIGQVDAIVADGGGRDEPQDAQVVGRPYVTMRIVGGNKERLAEVLGVSEKLIARRDTPLGYANDPTSAAAKVQDIEEAARLADRVVSRIREGILEGRFTADSFRQDVLNGPLGANNQWVVDRVAQEWGTSGGGTITVNPLSGDYRESGQVGGANQRSERDPWLSMSREGATRLVAQMVRDALAVPVVLDQVQRAADLRVSPSSADGKYLKGGETIGEVFKRMQTYQAAQTPESRGRAVEITQQATKTVLEAMGVKFARAGSAPLKFVADDYGRPRASEPKNAKQAREVHDQILQLLPQALVDGTGKVTKFAAGKPLDVELHFGARRAHAMNAGAQTRIKMSGKDLDNIAKYGSSRYESVYLHEVGHGIEYGNPLVRYLEFMTWTERAAGEKPRGLASITGNSGYRSHEKGVRDEWLNSYAGKTYSGSGGSSPTSTHEIFTTGLQAIFFDDGAIDEKHRAVVLGILASAANS